MDFVPSATLIFVLFGFVGWRYGLKMASCLTNSLIVIGPLMVGLLIWLEWKTMHPLMYPFIGMIIVGIIGICLVKYYTTVSIPLQL